jgi:hypoxanthine-DNA glycosylase
LELESFAPVARRDARVLILGTLPGPESWRRRQYYAHPWNAFWRIMGELFSASPEQPYRVRLATLRAKGVAIWDVCQSAYRPSALDADIRRDSIVANDFPAFYATHRQIRLVCFNGQTAASLYRRLVLPGLPEPWREMEQALLPSTSPAYAGLGFEQKLERWREALSRVPGLLAAPQRSGLTE